MATFKPARTVNDLSEAELRSLVFSLQKLVFGPLQAGRWPDPDRAIDAADVVMEQTIVFDRFGLAPKPAR